LRFVRKGGKHVIVPLAPRTARALDLYLGERSSGPIFLATTGAAWTAPARMELSSGWPRGPTSASRSCPHSLRHTFITLALDAGVPLGDVQEAASHADPRTTMRYDRGRHGDAAGADVGGHGPEPVATRRSPGGGASDVDDCGGDMASSRVRR